MAEAEPHELRAYLLGQLSDEKAEQIESRLLTEPEYQEEYDIVVNEITDDYVAGRFEGKELHQVEDYFFKSSARREKLGFALAIKQRAAEPIVGKKIEKSRFWPYLAIAAALLIAVGGGLYIWRILSRNAEVDNGLVALQAAYRNERPFESRISNFNYAPYVSTRGQSDAGNIDQDSLHLAELKLLDAAKTNPTPASQYAFGKVCLAKKQFDEAIKWFDEALKGDPKSAQIYSDLGAAWLEKGKADVEQGKTDPSGTLAGRGMEELGRSLENLNRTLDLDGSSLEALFNRALCHQHIQLPEKAEEDWREYLKRDATSPWANEARRGLELLEQEKTKTSRTREQIIQDFVAAYVARDDNDAWAAFAQGRERTGNFIIEDSIDEYLMMLANNRVDEASDRLHLITYVGLIEKARAGDEFNIDRSRFYEQATADQRDRIVQARDLLKSGYALYLKSELEAALSSFSTARDIFSAAKDQCDALITQAFIGQVYLRIPNAKKGLEIFGQISKQAQEKNYRWLFVQSLLGMSDAQSSLDEISKSLDFANQSLPLAEKLSDNVSLIRGLQVAVSSHLTVNEYQRSLGAVARALTVRESNLDPKIKWPFYHEGALNFHFLKLPAAALEFEKEALRLAEASGVPLLLSRSYERLGFIYWQQGNFPKAKDDGERAYAEGEKISSDLSRTNLMAHSALFLGKLYRESRDFSKAIEEYDQALALYKTLELGIHLYEAHKGKFLALMESNRDDEAEGELVTTITLFENYRQKIAEESARDRFFDVEQDTYDLAIYFEYFRKKDVYKALDFAEMSRARSLLELMTSGGHVIADRGSLEINLKAGTTSLKATEIQTRIADGVQLLEYAILDHRLVAWVINKQTIRSTSVDFDADKVDKGVRDFLKVLSSPQPNQADAARIGRALFTAVIGSTRNLLDDHVQLCIISDKNLNLLPFAALISPSSGRYLAEDFALETSPSATAFIESSDNAQQRANNTPEKLLSVGDPAFDRTEFAYLPGLPASRREVEEIALLYDTNPLVGRAAVAREIKLRLREADVIHLATHALIDRESPLKSKLVLAANQNRDIFPDDRKGQEDSLQASEIYSMVLPRTRLVVLSACNTGIEQAYRGEGGIGFARPFIAAGVPLVVASLWPVESEATADFMISFHKYRKQQHLSTVEALHRAQLEFIHNPQPNSSPNFGWAAFVAMGGYALF
jgi:CHAT domain-containing protein